MQQTEFKKFVTNIRILCAAMVERAQSGHPGSCLGMAPLLLRMYEHLRYDPENPRNPDRDVFVISNAHACAILYVFNALIGFLPEKELKEFRQFGSLTPGHPEKNDFGVEITSEPLGQGVAEAVGFAIAQKRLGLENKVVCIFGDGCYQEGISQEAFSLAANLNLNNLIFIYDNNEMTIDGPTSLSMHENIAGRFKALNFSVLEIDSEDLLEAEAFGKCVFETTVLPKMVIFNSKIGAGTGKEGENETHGNPLGREEIEKMKKQIGTKDDFEILPNLKKLFFELNERNRKLYKENSVVNCSCNEDFSELSVGSKCTDMKCCGNSIKCSSTTGRSNIDNSIKCCNNNNSVDNKSNVDNSVKGNSVTNNYTNDLDKKGYIEDSLSKISCSVVERDVASNCGPGINASFPVSERDVASNCGPGINASCSVDYNCGSKPATSFSNCSLCRTVDFNEILNQPISIDLSGTKHAESPLATRSHFKKIMEQVPFFDRLFVGSADLSDSVGVKRSGSRIFCRNDRSGNFIHFGIREHAMVAALNALSAFGFVAVGSTFLNFVTYCFPALRLAALDSARVVLALSHDSIGIGEDGPTHQPVEALALLRATPNLHVLRPCDPVEVAFSLQYALQRLGPTCLILTRQNVEPVALTNFSFCSKGAYFLINEPNPHVTILSSGSEVPLCIRVVSSLKSKGIKASLVSFLSFEIFEEQEASYKKEILAGKVVSVEMLSTFGWAKYSQLQIGLDCFGRSGKKEQVLDFFGFTVKNVEDRICEFLEN